MSWSLFTGRDGGVSPPHHQHAVLWHHGCPTYNSTPFWHSLLRESIQIPRVKALSPTRSPSTSEVIRSPGCYFGLRLLKGQLQTEGSTTPCLDFRHQSHVPIVTPPRDQLGRNQGPHDLVPSWVPLICYSSQNPGNLSAHQIINSRQRMLKDANQQPDERDRKGKVLTKGVFVLMEFGTCMHWRVEELWFPTLEALQTLSFGLHYTDLRLIKSLATADRSTSSASPLLGSRSRTEVLTQFLDWFSWQQAPIPH